MTTRWGVACIFLVVPAFAACAAGSSGGNITGTDTGTGTPLTVSSTQPTDGETGFATNWAIDAHFQTNLDPSSPTSAFTVEQGGTPVAGSVTYAGTDATFTPSAFLAANLPFTATISTALKGADGGALSKPYTWSFTTGDCGRFVHVDSFPLGAQASDVFSEVMTTDGTNIYLLIEPASSNDYATLLTIDPQAKTVTSSTTIPEAPPPTAYTPPVDSAISYIVDLAWYQGALWASGDYWSSGLQQSGVFEVNTTTGMPEHGIPLPVPSDPNQEWIGIQGLASDGTNLYVSMVHQFFASAVDTAVVAKVDPTVTTTLPDSSLFLVSPVLIHQMDFGGGYLWILTEEGPPRRIDKVDPNTAATLGKLCVDQDGGNILYFNGDFWSASGSEMKILSLK